MDERLSKKERQERIHAQLRSNVTVRISSLAGQFGVTTETIRRDIDQLTKKGFANRTYGGAAAVSLAAEPGLLQREQKYVAERTEIGRYAASFVEPNDVVMIDCGSTVNHFARALATRPMNLVVITNCVPVAQRLASTSSFRVILCPGDYEFAEHGVFGQETADFLMHFRANIAILGASGLTETEVTEAGSPACWVKRAMIDRAERVALLIDSGKLGVQLFETVCPLESIDDLVVDIAPSQSMVGALEAAGVRLHIAT